MKDYFFYKFKDIWKVPSSIKSIDAVSLMENYMTALIAFEQCGALEENDTALINVGLRGAGLAAVDVATNVYRTKVYFCILYVYFLFY